MRPATPALLAGALLALGCQRAAAAPEGVTHYFWPLEEGRVYVYQVDEKVRRVMRVERVAREADGVVRVETESRLEGLDLPADTPSPIRAVFRLVPGQRAIYRTVGTASADEVLVLVGPVTPGTRWRTRAAGHAPVAPTFAGAGRGAAPVTPEGTCRIDRVGSRRVLDRETTCVEVACEFADPLFESTSRVVSCQGVGYVSTDETVTAKGDTQPATFGERLLEIR